MADYLIEGAVDSDRIASEIKKLGARKDTGGHSIFLGQVRDDIFDGRKVIAIDYSAYEGMVSIQADRIKEFIFNEYSDVLEICIIHSTGKVMVGEISMFVMVSAGHRDHASRACRRLVELIKEKLPVWKKELYDDDTHKWQKNT